MNGGRSGRGNIRNPLSPPIELRGGREGLVIMITRILFLSWLAIALTALATAARADEPIAPPMVIEFAEEEVEIIEIQTWRVAMANLGVSFGTLQECARNDPSHLRECTRKLLIKTE